MRIDILKCRAKTTKSGNWVYGIAGYDAGGEVVMRVVEPYDKSLPMDLNSIAEDAKVITTAYIDQNTIDRCTHLTDKNGQEIYENDIVLIDGTNVRGRVWYSNTSGRWHVVSLRGKGWTTTMKELKRQFKMAFTARKKGGSLPLYYVVQHGCTVIGNKHDTPELLKVDEQ